MVREYRTSLASRERNRMHARKTRQRKKEHMQSLQNRADELKNEQLRLKQAINEKNTASILLGMFSRDGPASGGSAKDVNPKVEELLRRSAEEIPDASKIPELPALILPGQHNSKKNKAAAQMQPPAAAAPLDGGGLEGSPEMGPQHGGLMPDDGIDYELLSKDRSKCTPAELDRIRRERNRMHAKRTRDRKRIFMEEMEVMIKQLESENGLLQGHLEGLSVDSKRVRSDSVSSHAEPRTPSLASTSPTVQPVAAPLPPPTILDATSGVAPSAETSAGSCDGGSSSLVEDKAPNAKQHPGVTVDQIKTLLAAAGAFDEPKKNLTGMMTISSVAAVVAESEDEHHDDTSVRSMSPRPSKRQCLGTNAPTSSASLSSSPSATAPISSC
eukprot:CAMPEP_0197437280 /NCGR_PEP_ID=MMETSP1175-20131217/4549_1 /TAXON_ID=1003142 /ORGANISM="Triceratium dubium, Strain CCMP147" /LENGTH=385 /DNA_ID=CAMNT_0042966761 /DNA_START=287 /DNA_END=1444 /DNA_ORIENTATION=-